MKISMSNKQFLLLILAVPAMFLIMGFIKSISGDANDGIPMIIIGLALGVIGIIIFIVELIESKKKSIPFYLYC